MSEIHVTGLFQYPLKSCRGIALKHARLTPFGLEKDRHWMVVDGKGRFLTQRRFPSMALIEAQPRDGGLVLRAPGMSEIIVAAPPTLARALPVRIWGFEGGAVDAGAAVAAWLSDYLRFPSRLATATQAFQRGVDPAYDGYDSRVMFADGFPFLLLSEASLAGLNARLTAPVTMDRFRPNIVVGGCEPHAEDGWGTLRIGDGLIFHGVKLCSRCTVPNVDPNTGERGPEPGATLARYRTAGDGKVYFGQNLIHESKTGSLRVGDVVTILA